VGMWGCGGVGVYGLWGINADVYNNRSSLVGGGGLAVKRLEEKIDTTWNVREGLVRRRKKVIKAIKITKIIKITCFYNWH